MSRQDGNIEVVKLVLISLALVFAISAFAIVLLKDGNAASVPVRTLKLPEPPKKPTAEEEEKAAKALWESRMAEFLQKEVDELKDRQKRADEAVAKLREKYEKEG